MADMFEPLRLSNEEFVELISGLEQAFSRRAAALVTDERLASAEVDVLDWEETGFNKDAIEKYEQPANYLYQMLLFAFADAPNRVISQWARTYDDSLQEEAVRRVGLIREGMPSLRRLWESKNSSVIPILGSVAYEIVDSLAARDETDRTVILSIAASRYGVLGRAEGTSVQNITIRLWPSDLVLLKREIDHIFG
jgi:hypothetical protein